MPVRITIAGLALALAAFAVLWTLRPGPARAPRPLAVVASGDTAGWLVPCGCTSNQSGGLLRRGTFIRDLQQSADVVYVDAGGAPGGTSAYHRFRFEAILRGEQAMGLVAHNLGGTEVALGTDYLREVAGRLKLTFVSANLRDAAGRPIADATRGVTIGGRRIAITGVLSRRYEGNGLQIEDPRSAVLFLAAALKGKYDALIVLAYMPEEELREFAAGLPEVDAVIGGPTGQAIAPQPAGPTLLAAATNKGKFLAQLDAPPIGGRWTGRVVELDKTFSDDPEQEANVRRYLDDLGHRDFAAADTGFGPPLPSSLPNDYRLAGDNGCKTCHTADDATLSGSKHAHAWRTLEAKGYHVDPSCQQCHTTGFGLPGGFDSAKRSPALVNVGCESCHGPASAHARDPKTRTPFAARDQCVRCHDRENSPNFAYAPFWDKIRHGVKVGGPAGGGS